MRAFLYKQFVVLLTMLSLTPVVLAGGDAPRKKPQSPVQVSVAPADAAFDPAGVRRGDTVSLQVVAVPALDAPELSIVISLDGGVEPVSGNLTWSGPSIKGQAVVVPLVVRVPGGGKGKVKAKVEIGAAGQGRFSTHAAYEFGTIEKQKTEGPRAFRKDRQGQVVEEYR